MATTWVVTAASERVQLSDGKAEVGFTVTNPSAAPDRAMFTVVPGPGAAASWFAVDEPQRSVGGGSSTSYVVRVAVPAGTAAGSYELKARVYSADSAPEETSTQSGRVAFDVAAVAAPPPPPKQRPWWLLAVIAAVVVVTGLIAWILTRGDDGSTPIGEVGTIMPISEQVPHGQMTFPIQWEAADGATHYDLLITYRCSDPQTCPDAPKAQPLDTDDYTASTVKPGGSAHPTIEYLLPITEDMTKVHEVRWQVVPRGDGAAAGHPSQVGSLFPQ